MSLVLELHISKYNMYKPYTLNVIVRDAKLPILLKAKFYLWVCEREKCFI